MKSALIVCLLWFCTASGHAMGADSAFWKWSPYVATGVGLPQGMRTEVGMHFDTYGSIAITHGLYTTWARESTRPMFGLNARVFVPGGVPFHPYLAVGGGGTIEIFGGSDEYWQAMAGAMVPVTHWLVLRPEVGALSAKKHISGGPGLWSSSPEVYTRTMYMFAHIALEVDILPIFSTTP
jgi:hypothetical protein